MKRTYVDMPSPMKAKLDEALKRQNMRPLHGESVSIAYMIRELVQQGLVLIYESEYRAVKRGEGEFVSFTAPEWLLAQLDELATTHQTTRAKIMRSALARGLNYE